MPGGDRKYGTKKQVPAQKRYTAEARWVKNARLRRERHARRVQADAVRVQTIVPRGVTRETARDGVDWTKVREDRAHGRAKPWRAYLEAST